MTIVLSRLARFENGRRGGVRTKRPHRRRRRQRRRLRGRSERSNWTVRGRRDRQRPGLDGTNQVRVGAKGDPRRRGPDLQARNDERVLASTAGSRRASGAVKLCAHEGAQQWSRREHVVPHRTRLRRSTLTAGIEKATKLEGPVLKTWAEARDSARRRSVRPCLISCVLELSSAALGSCPVDFTAAGSSRPPCTVSPAGGTGRAIVAGELLVRSRYCERGSLERPLRASWADSSARSL